MKSVFGWNYPPGAAHDPRAPYNEVDTLIEGTVTIPGIHGETTWDVGMERDGVDSFRVISAQLQGTTVELVEKLHEETLFALVEAMMVKVDTRLMEDMESVYEDHRDNLD